jgi:hypothetical protein
MSGGGEAGALPFPKAFRLARSDIRDLARGYGACFASDRIMVDGMKAGFCYREAPDFETDSGWRFFAGDESLEYTDCAGNFGIYDVNTIANYDADIIPLLDAPEGVAFAREDDGGFAPVPDWKPELA